MTYVITWRCGAAPFARGCGTVITVRSESLDYSRHGILCPVCKQETVGKVGEA